VSAERWQRLGRVFEEARHLAGEARSEYVADACRDDEALYREATDLLTASDASGEFLEQPAIERLARSVAADGPSLRAGERLGAYTLDRPIGAGGAGEVWRARDERLARDVAIKVLLPHVSTDADRVRRFIDEARTAGSLNHSNILTVYDVGEHHGVPYLVTEYLEGQSLRQLINGGRVPAEDAVRVAIAIARGLSAAHARGVVHRDLKPENVFLTSQGVVKILDFGLAKLQPGAGTSPEDHVQTMTGLIVGTAGYMAPEQVRGEAVDARADLFAIGVMLYELLAAQHPFKGASAFETLHAVLSVPPKDVGHAGSIPESVWAIAMRLLEKAPGARFQSALDLLWALEHADLSRPVVARGRRERTFQRGWRRAPVLALTGLGIAGLGVLGALPLWRRSAPVSSEVTQFTVALPDAVALASAPAVSPSGRQIAFVGRDVQGARLFVRDLGAREAEPIPGTEGATQPFWSADGTSIGFFARQQLMKVAWRRGAPVAIARAPMARGGAWSRDGIITFAPDIILSGLSRVPAAGGHVEPATVLDAGRGDTSHWRPALLPDGSRFLYHVRSTQDERLGVYLGDSRGPAQPAGDPVFRAPDDVVFASSGGSGDGVLLYVAGGRIEARRFDASRQSVESEAHALGLSAAGGSLFHPPLLSASADVLVFAERPLPGGNRLEALTRDGHRVRTWDNPEAQNWPRVSPDGRRLARQRVDGLRNNPDIWVDDLERGTRVRITTAPEPDIHPVWSPDGRNLAYVSGNLPRRRGDRRLTIAAADGTGVVRSFPCPAAYCEPTDWSPDGRNLLVNVLDETIADVWMISADGRQIVERLLATGAAEEDARFSPNGAWIAYVSQESGRSELSVRSRSNPPSRIVLSGAGGAQPVWRRDGSELYYVDPDGRLQAVSVQWTAAGEPRFGLPARLDLPPVGFGHWGTQYDVSRDGRQFFVLRPNHDPAPRELHVVMGWSALLHER
jgi:serine/threonine protein kinase/Tol biopolymer transport system component